MKIRVSFLDSAMTIAAVHVRPSWLDWLLGCREFDAIAACRAGTWAWDVQFRALPIHQRIADAIDRAHTVACVSQRLETLYRIDDATTN